MNGIGRHGYFDPGSDDWFDSEAGDSKVVPADAIVIERGDLPVVSACDDGPDRVHVTGDDEEMWISGGATADSIRATALRGLAIAEYLAAHPPVDEVQVEALAGDISSLAPGEPVDEIRFRDLARRLVQQGWAKQEATR